MGLFDKFKKKDKLPMFLYSEQEIEEYEKHVSEKYGEFKTVFHEIASPDIHLDIIPVPPTEDAPFYKLITAGAGAFPMNVPKELKDYKLEYAEYVMYLPPDWKLNSTDPEDFWPIGRLKSTARIPINCDTWLGYGHTIHANADFSPFASNTKLNSLLLVAALGLDGKKSTFTMSSGKVINMYHLIPLYQEELEFKMENGADAMLDLFPEEEFPPILHLSRKNLCEK